MKLDQDEESKKLIKTLPETAAEAHILEEENNFLHEEANFHAGENSKMDTLYHAFWKLMESAVTAIQHKDKVGEEYIFGQGFQLFTNIQSFKTDIKNENERKCQFERVSETTKNLIKAIIEVNTQINKIEDGISKDLSIFYKNYAEEAFLCLVELNKNIDMYRSNINEKVENIQSDVLRESIGNEFSQFTTKALQTLQMWYEVHREIKLLSEKTQDPFLLSFVKMKVKNDTSSFNDLKLTISDVKSQIKYLQSGLKNVKYHVPREISSKNNKLLLRIQKHNLMKTKENEIKKGYLNPLDLAEKLRLIQTSESEIDEALEKLDEEYENENSTAVDTKHLHQILKTVEENIEKMFDISQKLELKVNKVKSTLTSQLTKDYAREINLHVNATKQCILEAKQKCEEEKTRYISYYTQFVNNYKLAERTVLKALKETMITNRHETLNIENCLQSVLDASKQHKIIRDTEILNEHRQVLQGYMKAIKSFIHH